MTFEQFQTSREWHNDLSYCGSEEAQPGFLYAGNLRIFGMGGGAAPAEYLLVIGNSQKVSADLDDLERDLYEYGCAEEILN